MRNKKTKKAKIFSPKLSFLLNSSTSSPPWQHMEMENGDTLSLLLLSFHILPPLQCRVFPIECRYSQTFKQAIIRPTEPQELLQCRSFSQGTTLQEQTAPEWVPHGRGVLTKICCLWPTFHGQEFLPESSPGWAFHGVTGNICLLCEPFMAFRAGICSSSVLHALQGNLCSGIWSILSPAPHLLH